MFFNPNAAGGSRVRRGLAAAATGVALAVVSLAPGAVAAAESPAIKFVQDKPEAVRGFLKALNRAVNDVVADPEAAMDYVMKREPLLDRDVEKVVVITGPAKGMGRAVTLAFAAEGARLVLAGRDVAAIEPVAREAREMGAQAIVVPRDLTDAGQTEALAQAGGVFMGGREVGANPWVSAWRSRIRP